VITYTPLAVVDLTGPDANPIDPAKWTTVATFTELQQKNHKIEGTPSGFALYSGLTPSDDQYVDITFSSLSGHSEADVFLRSSNNPRASGYDFELTDNGDGTVVFSITRAVGGALTALYIDVALPFTPGDAFRFVAFGTTISAYKNGTLLFSTTDISVASGKVALALFGSGDGSNAAVSAFTIGSVTDPARGGIVQHKSAVAHSSSTSVALNAPVTKGNLIVVGIADQNGEVTSYDGTKFSDNFGTSYAVAVQEYTNNGFSGEPAIAALVYALANQSGSLTVNYNDPLAGMYTLHVYEVAGYDTLDKVGVYPNSANTQVSSAAVSTSSATTRDKECGLALFQAKYGFHDPITWTGDGGNEGAETADDGTFRSSFSEGFEVTSKVVVTATATLTNVSGGTLGPAVIATFYKSAPPSNLPFLGSVTAGDAPAGASNPFLGTVQVLTVAPSGAPNPYLGKVKVLSVAPAGVPNNVVGSVVVIGSVPTGQADIFLGSVVETS